MSDKNSNTPKRPVDAHHAGLPWRKLNHLACAFALGVVLTAAVFLTTPPGKQAPSTPSAYDSKLPTQTTSRGAAQRPNAAASDQHTAGTGGQHQPVDPQEQLRQIQAINDYNRRLTQPDIPGLPTDPARTSLPHDPAQPPSPYGAPSGP